ncbi:MAG: hypothetical protein Ta2G_03140 [Termitinemataceae bacterium]|nr:MAG: hypothetical protein Ta2G_03140 [Termitinemataceae bacterium]
MKVGTKYIVINKNISKVENDLKILTGNSESEDFYNKLEVFYGETNGRIFYFYSENKNYSRLDSLGWLRLPRSLRPHFCAAKCLHIFLVPHKNVSLSFVVMRHFYKKSAGCILAAQETI